MCPIIHLNTVLLLHSGTAISRTVSLRQAKMPSDSSSLQVTERIVTEGEAFSIQRSRALWYPPPLFEWKTGRMQDKRQTDYVLSQRVQLDSETGIDLLTYSQIQWGRPIVEGSHGAKHWRKVVQSRSVNFHFSFVAQVTRLYYIHTYIHT